MNEYQYTIILDPDLEEGGYTVTVPALPGCVTQGETIEEAIAMAKDAIRLYIETLLADGQPIPQESERHHAELWFMGTFADSGTEGLFRSVWEANTLLVLFKREW